MWATILTIFKRRQNLRTAGLLALCVALITTLFFDVSTHAAPGINRTISFQGRLQYSTGGAVADGFYNMQFKIYQDGTSTSGGTLEWTEAYVNNNNGEGVEVKNGYFSVELGTNNPFASQVDWNQDTLWLTMNVAGSANNCTTFNSGACIADGEMNPRQRFTSTPYSLNSGALNGKTAENFVQLGQGSQTDSGSNSSIFINKTGAGNLLQLQNTAEDILTVSNAGDLTLGNNANHTIQVASADASTNGNSLTISAGAGGSGSGNAGGSLILQGGSAGGTNSNGGNIVISGGTGTGTGVSGLVILGTPTYSTVTNDAGCYTGGSLVASSCSIAASSVNNASAVIVGFSTTGQAATLIDPTITTAGRVVHVLAANGTQDFTLRANVGDGTGVEHNITVRQNTTVAMIWNGSNWSPTGASSTTTLQDALNNTPLSSGGAELTVRNNDNGGLTIRDSSSNPVNGTLLEIQSMSAANYFSVKGNVSELATNPGAEQQGASTTTFPANTWSALGTATVTRQATTGNYIAAGSGSVKVAASAANSGTHNRIASTLTADTIYNVSVSVRLESGTFTDLGVYYTPDGDAGNAIPCQENNTVTTTGWKKISCSFTTPSSGITSTNTIMLAQVGNATRTFYIDNLSVTQPSNSGPNVQIGGGQTGGPATLLTVDQSASVPTAETGEALYGSMYYDTTIGKLQCYEADGWGACGEAPDTFVTLTPEFSGAVMNGSTLGTMTTDICSDDLDINDATNGPQVCDANETYNFYNWNSAETSVQTKSVYVNYLLPSSFKEFVQGSTSLLGRRDASTANVSYQVYRSDNGNLTACGSAVTVTSSDDTWQTGTATGTSDPFDCGSANFEPGDSIVIRINMAAEDNANAYVSNLRFIYSNN